MDLIQKINCSFTDESSLHAAFMPYVLGGGLFIHTEKLYPLGKTIHMSVALMDEPELYEIEGKVVWITPLDAQDQRLPGIGVQFLVDNRDLFGKIVTYLAGGLHATSLTHTI